MIYKVTPYRRGLNARMEAPSIYVENVEGDSPLERTRYAIEKAKPLTRLSDFPEWRFKAAPVRNQNK